LVASIIALLAGILIFVLVWVFVSLPLYMAARIVTDGRATLGAAMIGTLLGALVYYITFLLSSQVSGYFVSGDLPVVLGIVLGFLAFLGFYKALFHTTWPRALLIAILAVVITVVILFVLAAFAAALGLALLS